MRRLARITIIWSCSKCHKAAATALAAALILSLLSPAASAAGHGRALRPLCIVLGTVIPETQALQPILTARYPTATLVPTVSRCPEDTPLALSIGPAALRDVAGSSAHYPSISLFVTREEYLRTVGKRVDVTAIYAEVSPAVQLQLVRALYQRSVRVAVLLSEETEDTGGLFMSAAAKLGLAIQVIQVPTLADPARALVSTKTSDVVVLIPDPGLLSAVSFRNILEVTYRRGEGVIGFSSGQVTAGTLAAPVASLSDILAQLDEIIEAYRTRCELPAPAYPRFWSVSVNESVAHSLDLVITDRVRQMASRPEETRKGSSGDPDRAGDEGSR